MNFIQRAFKNVTRKLSRSILLIITFFVIGNFVIIGLGVANAADNAKTLTRQKMRAVVTYEVNYDEIYKYINGLEDQDVIDEFYQNYPSVKMSDVKDLIADGRVKAANAFYSYQSYLAEGYDFVHLNNDAEQNIGPNGQECWVYEDGTEQCNDYRVPTHFIKSNLFPNMIEFIDGGFEIVDGAFYTQEDIDKANNVLLVSKAFAEVNNLKVGDTYTFYVEDPSSARFYEGLEIDEDMLKKDFEVIGIFDHQSKITPDQSNYNWTSPYENPDNMLLMPATSLYASRLSFQQLVFDYYSQQYPDDGYYKPENRPSMDSVDDIGVNDVTFLLNDPLEVDEFINDYSDNLPQFMNLNANNEEFKRLSKPLDTLGLYAKFIIWLVVINAIIIISLVTALTLKTREYEIGVLLSIGASKLKIVAQFFIELALVAIIGFTLAIGSGSLVASKVGEQVLEYQIQESELDEEEDYYTDYNYIWDTDYSTEISLNDLVSEYDVKVSPLIIGEIYVMGLGIVLISIIVPSMMIMRFNPKKILMNQY